jgi:hypothetical protein
MNTIAITTLQCSIAYGSLYISDIRDAREQQNTVFERVVNETYLCWQKKPRR